MTQIAIIKESPVLLDRTRTLNKAVQLAGQAAAAGAELVVFPEAYISGYPSWVWRLRPGGDWGHQRGAAFTSAGQRGGY